MRQWATEFHVHAKYKTKHKKHLCQQHWHTVAAAAATTALAPRTNCNEHIQKLAPVRAAHLNRMRQTLCGVLAHFCMFVHSILKIATVTMLAPGKINV